MGASRRRAPFRAADTRDEQPDSQHRDRHRFGERVCAVCYAGAHILRRRAVTRVWESWPLARSLATCSQRCWASVRDRLRDRLDLRDPRRLMPSQDSSFLEPGRGLRCCGPSRTARRRARAGAPWRRVKRARLGEQRARVLSRRPRTTRGDGRRGRDETVALRVAEAAVGSLLYRPRGEQRRGRSCGSWRT